MRSLISLISFRIVFKKKSHFASEEDVSKFCYMDYVLHAIRLKKSASIE